MFIYISLYLRETHIRRIGHSEKSGFDKDIYFCQHTALELKSVTILVVHIGNLLMRTNELANDSLTITESSSWS